MKPKSWTDCPHTVLETLLWDLDLKYDTYESSKAETVHQILNNPDSVYDYNLGLIKGTWDAMSETEWIRRATNAKESLENWLDQLDHLETLPSRNRK
jgi:hypothetical protein